jgi:AmmeMemoRadiSam system protein A
MLSEVQHKQLIDIAWQSLRHGLTHGAPLPVDTTALDETLSAPGASFVTLHRHGQLRGCIGSLEPHQPLATDVAQNAFSAAFRDPRFPPLTRHELDGLTLDISVLGTPEAITFSSEQDLLRQLRPGTDGLILEERGRRGTFLPSVWESLQQPAEFLRHLKLKAGLPADYWSDDIQVWRYTTESFGDKTLSASTSY